MAKKGSRLREFEKTHRVLDISAAQESRKEKKKLMQNTKLAAAAEVAAEKSGKPVKLIRLAAVAVLVTVIVLVSLSVKNIIELKAEEEAVANRNQELLQTKEDLLLTLDNVNSDEYIEEQARKELHLAKGNELIFYFPENWDKKHSSEEESEKNE